MNESNFPINADTLHRAVKMALDSGEAKTIEEAYALFSTYCVGVHVGEEARTSAAHQAALLSIVNAGRRTLLGGVFVAGALDAPLLVPALFGGQTLGQAVEGMGGFTSPPPDAAPTLLVGTPNLSRGAGTTLLRLTFNDWAGGVAPPDHSRLSERSGAVLGAVLAAGIALSEVFQHLRDGGRAGHRICGISAWSPAGDWRDDTLPPLSIVPSRLWVLGLGHLGQAFLWTLALLVQGTASQPLVLLHDFDELKPANDSTSLLIDSKAGGMKTRVVAQRLEAVGLCTRIVERAFDGSEHLQADDPRVAFCGVDNGPTRAMLDRVGFSLVVEAGLGNGDREYNALRLHTFPASRAASTYWSTQEDAQVRLDADAYRDLQEKGMDACGLVQLATRSVGVPFVGLVATALALGEMCRALIDAPRFELIDLSLRDPTAACAVPLDAGPIGNPGYFVRATT
jgi:hypothetical protein